MWPPVFSWLGGWFSWDWVDPFRQLEQTESRCFGSASDVGLKYMATSFSFAWLDPPKSVLHRYLATSGRLGSAGRSWFLLAGVVI